MSHKNRIIRKLVYNDGLSLGDPSFTPEEQKVFDIIIGEQWYMEQTCPRRSDRGIKKVGQTCICGKHYTECSNCKERYFTWQNPHYVPSVGHDTWPGDAIEPYYICKKQ